LETEAFKRRWFFTRFYNDWPLLLARFGKGTYQNQVEIKLDVGLDTFRSFINRGKIPLQQRRSLYGVEAKNGLVGTAMLLDEASVTGTANIVMAAVLAKGTTPYTMLLVNLTCSNYVRC
jgi:UDP-N-acetylglucosamine 1-carboxyvinyltransferase